MDYESKYNELVEAARAVVEGNPGLCNIDEGLGRLRKLLPEKESEDERIRTRLIALVEAFGQGKYKDEMLAYLEKQKEQKLEENNVYPHSLDEAIQLYYFTYGNGKGGFDYLSLPKFQDIVEGFVKDYGQKPAEWESEYAEEDLQTRFAFYTYKDEPKVLYLSNLFVEESSRNHGYGTRILEATEEVADVFGANFIRLKVKKDSPANEWYRKHGYELNCTEDDYDWLEKDLTKEPIEEFIPVEKTLEYKVGFNDGVKSIKHAEWSKEEEKDIQEASDYLRDYANNYVQGGNSKLYIQSLADRIESLRHKPHWKPSDEQMGALKYASTYVPDDEGTLTELYEQLKKL